MKDLILRSSSGAHPEGIRSQAGVIGDFGFVAEGPGGGLPGGAYECSDPIPRSIACTVSGEMYSFLALPCNPGGPPCFVSSSVPFRIPWALECVWECPCLDLQHCISSFPSILDSGPSEVQLLSAPAPALCCTCEVFSKQGWLDPTVGVWAPKKWIGGSGPLAMPHPWSFAKVLFLPGTASFLAQVSLGVSPWRCSATVFRAYCSGPLVFSLGEGGSGAPKNHIGGSGLIALAPHSLVPEPYGSFGTGLDALAAWIVPFFRSLLVILGCCLGRLLVCCLPWRPCRACKFCRSFFTWLPLALVLPLGCARPSQVVLCWQPAARSGGRRPPRQSHFLHPGGPSKLGSLLAFLGFVSLPHVVWASPFMPGTAIWAIPFLHVGLCSGTADVSFTEFSSADTPDGLPVSRADRLDVTRPFSATLDVPVGVVDSSGPGMPDLSVSRIGVTVHAPYFPSVAFNFTVDRTAGLEAMIASIQQLDCLPCPSHDCMVELKPQRHAGFISLLSYHSVLDQFDTPKRAVMFDLSCVGGHLHPRVMPRCVSWDNLAAVVCRLINVDIFEEDVTIWVGASQTIMDRSTPCYLCHGDVLVFVRSHWGPPIGHAASSLFQTGVVWHHECHPTGSLKATCEAVCDCDRVFTVDMSFFRPLCPKDIALRQSRVSSSEHKVTEVEISPPLNLDGEICARIYVVAPPCGQAGTTAAYAASLAACYLLDLRILSLPPQLVLGQPALPDLPDILRAAGLALPKHLCGVLLSNRLFEQVQVLKIGVGPDLASSVMCFPSLRGSIGDDRPVDLTDHSAPPHSGPGVGGSQWGATTHGPVVGAPTPPTRFDRELPEPDPHLVLNLTRDEVMVVEPISYDAGFSILIPGFVAERVQVRLSNTCTVEEALSDVADVRDTLAAVHFEQLVPVFPQPDLSFACVLALPMWGLHSRIGVFDTRAVDGRLFAVALAERLNRASILLHAGLPVVDTLQVFAGDELMDAHRWFPLHQGILITILPHDFVFQHGGSLETRLLRATGWAIPCPSFGGVEGPKFSMLSDGNGAVLRVDLDVITSSAFFKAEAARLFRFDVEKVTICPSVPRLRNVSVLGDDCDALLVATESICRIPVPPGRPQVKQHIVFLDKRLLLSPISWIKAPHGVLDYEYFLRGLNDLAPPGFEVSVQGGRQEHRGRRTFLHVAHGDVLTCVPVGADHCMPSSISTPGSGQASEHDGEGSESSSDGSSDCSSPDDMSTGAAEGSHSRHPAPRSRSPRGRTRPLIPASPTCWMTGLGLASLVLPTKAVSVSWDVRPLTFHRFAGKSRVQGSLLDNGFGLGFGLGCLLSCHIGLGRLPYVCSGCFRSRSCQCSGHACPSSAKLDSEPVVRSAHEQQVLDHLRSLTLSLGGPRMPGAPSVPLDFLLFVAEDSPVQTPRTRTRRVSCTVLKHDYVNEVFEVDLVVPATEAEALQVIQVSRERCYRELFPVLHPVTPQPFHGEVVCIASPCHQVGYVSVCLDTSAYDHRLFVACVPIYVSWGDLVAAADLPPQTSPEVWIDNVCLLANNPAQVHAFTGMCARLIPPGEPVPDSAPWHDLLLDIGPRHHGSVRPQPSFPVAYCLAFRGPGRLFLPDSRRPTDKRRHIAHVIGVDVAHLRLFPAVPRPSDIAFCGVACRTAIGACVMEPSVPARDWCLIHLDCRPLADGWRTVKVFFGTLDVRRLLEELDAEAPLGFRTRIRGLPPFTEILPVDSGAVLVLYYEDIGYAPAFPVQSTSPDTAAIPVASEEQTVNMPSSSTRQAAAPDSSVDPDLQDAEAEGSVSGMLAASGPRSHFLILAPEYCPDLVSLNTSFPISVDDVLVQVSALREPLLASRFPRLLPVPIQPVISFACLLALPSWEFEGVPILIVCYVPPFRVMAVVVGSLLAPDDILRLVGVPDDGAAQVFHADMPWAIPPGRQVDVEPGALFTVLQVGHPWIPPVTLTAILASAEGWHYDPVLPGPFVGAVWVLTTTDHFRLSYDFRPDLGLPEAISFRTGIARDTLTILPAHPPIHDRYHQGMPLRQVFLSLADLTQNEVPFFLDQRPVLSTLVWMVAREGRVDVAAICSIQAARCPPTHFVRLLGGFAPPGTANHQRYVYPGQVLTVEFQLRRSYYAPGNMPDDDDSSEGSSSDESGDGPDEDDGSRLDAVTTSSHAASSLPDAGTGSTQAPGGTFTAHALLFENQRVRSLPRVKFSDAFHWLCRGVWYHGMVKCFLGLIHDVHFVGSPGLTPVLLCSMLLLECLDRVFLVLVRVPVWVRAGLGLCGIGSPTAGRRQRVMLTVFLVLYQCDLCTATAEHLHAPAGATCIREVQYLSVEGQAATRAIATPCRSRNPVIPAHPHPRDSLREEPSVLGSAYVGRVQRASRPPNRMPQPSCTTIGPEDSRRPDDADLAECVDGPTLLELVPEGDKFWAWFNASTLVETLEEHFAGDPPYGRRGTCTEVRQQVSLAETIPLSAFQCHALSLNELLPSASSHHQRPEELLDWLDNDLRGLMSDPAVPRNKLPLFSAICRWHSVAADLEPDSISVYTDGSSVSGPRPAGLPGAWAISVWVVVGDKEFFLGYAADTHVSSEDDRFVGAYEDSPLSCEQLALVWALVWVIQFGASLSLPTCLVYDCQAAGLGAFGLVKAPSVSSTGGANELSLFACYLRQLAHSRTTLTHRHVKAHVGCMANELCDELAKRARRTSAGCSGDILPVWPGRLFAHPLKSWAWLPQGGSADLPSLFSFESEAGRLQASDPVGESGPVLGRRQTRSSKAPCEFCVCFVTVNILTLLDPGRGGAVLDSAPQQGLRIVAKRELLKQQFLQEGALLIGLQETRLQETATLPDGQFVMLHAAADARGHYGVALWANTTIPYAHKGEAKWFLARSHFTVVECLPRLLIVSIRAPFLSWVVVVAHAPSEPPAPPGSAAAFWFSGKNVLSRCSQDADIILLADANARLGGLVSDSVGPHGAEEESKTASDFHQFLAETTLQLPSTFVGCHSGICHTWTSPTGLRHRIDYIAVPITWPLSCIQTHVWDTFEALQLRDDHFPLVLRAALACRSRDDSSVCFSRAAVRPSTDADPSQYLVGMTQVLSSRPIAWHAGVDSHYAHLGTEWARWGRTLCRPEERKPRQSYLTAATLQLVAWRKAWRSQLHVWKQWHRSRTLAICLLLWRSEVHPVAFGPSGISGLCAWADQFLLCIAQAALLIYRVGRHIKSSAKGDRAAYLAKLAHEVTLSDLKDPKLLYQRVRRAFPASRTGKRSQFCPLPAVYNSDGDLAHSMTERQECWRQHFAAQEAGDLIEASDYSIELRRQRNTSTGRESVFDIRCVPTLADVEQTILGLQPGKATGSDGISAELLRVHAPTSARLLAGIYVKSALTIYEPVEFRGGSLIPLAKRAAAAFSMDKFRSILVSSLPGKVLHRQYRTALISPLQQVRGDLQAGALPGISTEAIIMAARTFRDIMAHRRHAWSLTFFDVRAAYYRVLRQILVKTGDQEWALRKLLHELGVPPQALQELAQKMDGIGILADAGVPEHLCHLLADAMQGTWFRIDCGTALTLTRRGVRPGDCLADVLFSFTFSAYLASTGEALRRAGVCTEMPQVDARSPWRTSSVDMDLSCASWADDFVHLAAQTCLKTIATRVVRVVEIFTGQADSIGMQLTFATDKTATMLSHLPMQDGPVQEDTDGKFLIIESPVTGACHRLPVVSAYRHLGGIATVSGTPAPEIGFRHSLAWKVVRPLRSRLFSAYGIPFSTRCLLLRSLVMSRYMFGSAALPLHAAVHRRLWAKHFVALWRVLWRRQPGEHSRHSYAVLGAARAPTPPLALALARAVLFRQMLASGPSSLLHLLFVHWIESPRHAWLGMLLEDIQHVAQYIPEVRVVVNSRDWLATLVHRLYDSPNWWVARVKAAVRCAVADMQPWCAPPQAPTMLADTSCAPSGRLQGRDGLAVPAPVTDLPFPCHWCNARFRLRKHLFVHLARTHQVFAPARHLAHGDTCVSCMRCFHSVPRLQQHLKRTDYCMLRTCQLVPCLSVEEVKLAEASVSQAAKQLRKGNWGAYVAALPAAQASGPRQLTSRERLELSDEDLDLGLISRMFFPDPVFQAWVTEFVAERSVEGPRDSSLSFWDVRPSSQKFHQNSVC